MVDKRQEYSIFLDELKAVTKSVTAFVKYEEKCMKIEKIFDINITIYAHRKDDSEQKETLQEHTERCEKYFNQLLKNESIKDSLNTIEKEWLSDYSDNIKKWFQDALFGIISLHDTGKINPRFQQEKMLNDTIIEVDDNVFLDSFHSIYSAYIYIDYFGAELERIIDEEGIKKNNQPVLFEILLINAYIIMQHHSDLANYGKIFEELAENGKIDLIDNAVMAGKWGKFYRGKFSKKKIRVLGNSQKRICDYYSNEKGYLKYIYSRLMYSLLTAADYYATCEYMNGNEITDFGNIQDIQDINVIYESTELVKNIRKYDKSVVDDGKNINYLRNCMFHEAEDNLIKNIDNNIFFLEAPTGSGKSNIAYNCSFKMAKAGKRKIFYVYPFNNLVEQNRITLKELFDGKDILKNIAIINSVTPINQCRISDEKEYYTNRKELFETYQKALLDRQFLNYPVVLTTHVSLFQTMFSTQREQIFGFHQLAGSVIVLDEIQSYKNDIWAEIMKFLQMFAKYMHCKVLIMSATLPDLTYLSGYEKDVTRLITNRTKYFNDSRFCNRVNISYNLIKIKDFNIDKLCEHVIESAKKKKKVLVEFIKKDTAYKFFDLLKEMDVDIPIERITGDDNIVDREQVLKNIKDDEYCKNGVILVATQVIEAGVDIDMDIGYKDISILDSEEQFLGRINRNYKRDGIVRFFDIDTAKGIYRGDFRVNGEFTLVNEEMQKILENKEFGIYYDKVLQVIKKNLNESKGDAGLEEFEKNIVYKLNYKKIEERMELISEDKWNITIFLARAIQKDNEEIDGSDVWKKYKALLMNPPINYAEFRVLMSEIMSKLSLFVYKVQRNKFNLPYDDNIGEIYYIENGDNFFVDDKLDKQKILEAGALFIDI